MSEIEKMYRNVLGYVCNMPDVCCFHECEKCDCYITFTPEKQLELIKWIGKNMNGFNVFYDTSFNSNEKHYWCCADQCYEDFTYGCHKKDFNEALAGLINELSLSEEEKQQIKEILE